MIVRIARALLQRVLVDVVATPDLERCGLMFGSADRIEQVQPAANVARDPAHWFEVDPVILFAALRAERAGGPRLIGHYHSHPSGLAVPSPRDLAAAEPGRLWLILGGGEVRLWLAEPDAFRELKLQVD